MVKFAVCTGNGMASQGEIECDFDCASHYWGCAHRRSRGGAPLQGALPPPAGSCSTGALSRWSALRVKTATMYRARDLNVRGCVVWGSLPHPIHPAYLLGPPADAHVHVCATDLPSLMEVTELLTTIRQRLLTAGPRLRPCSWHLSLSHTHT